MESSSILKVKNLRTYFNTDKGIVKAVDGVEFSIGREETLAVVGESGCGKSVMALSLMRLIPQPPGKIASGEILYKGDNILSFSDAKMRKMRGNDISMIFQEPMTSLNPVFRIGEQIAESLRIHQEMSRQDASDRAVEMLDIVGIPSARQRAKEYPYQMSGGMRQRVMIAIAFACNPNILIADEPTTALDVTIQAQILNLMREMKERNEASILLITHDLGVVAENTQRVIVMYAGKIVETAAVKELFKNPLHPYTRGLLESVPRKWEAGKQNRIFTTIKGRVPSLIDLPPGCSFYNRCLECSDNCTREEVELLEVNENHWVRCVKYR